MRPLSSIELHWSSIPSTIFDRSSSLNYLDISLQTRFEQQGVLSDLDEAIELHRAALALRRPRFQRLDVSPDLDEAFGLYLRLSSISCSLSKRSQCSIRHGSLTTAVELVEQGRAVFWTQLARFRIPPDELSVSAFAFVTRSISPTEDQSLQIRQLTVQWDDVVSRIRLLPDFSRFLLPPLFSAFQKAAKEGPILSTIPLDIALTDVSELSSEFQYLAEQFGSSDHQHKLGVKIHPGSRIWWCPTAEFTLLPLHAAGPYEGKRDNLSHICISSYTPTLVTLIRARQQVSQDASL
ncbi:hypothetical protein EDB19DRAFT_1912419 [Suillus lakei]|nr:hypothetical protein EDB19DRAFT_1912419 [Suillus lakei]